MNLAANENNPSTISATISRMSSHSSTLTARLPHRLQDPLDQSPAQRPDDDAGDDVVGDVANHRDDEPRHERPALVAAEFAHLVEQHPRFFKHRCSPCDASLTGRGH